MLGGLRRRPRRVRASPLIAPLRAESHADLPPAIVVLGGCDFLRDEGRAYAVALRDAGVDVEAICYPGQIHGFINQMFPAAADAFERIGTWVQARFAALTARNHQVGAPVPAVEIHHERTHFAGEYRGQRRNCEP